MVKLTVVKFTDSDCNSLDYAIKSGGQSLIIDTIKRCDFDLKTIKNLLEYKHGIRVSDITLLTTTHEDLISSIDKFTNTSDTKFFMFENSVSYKLTNSFTL